MNYNKIYTKYHDLNIKSFYTISGKLLLKQKNEKPILRIMTLSKAAKQIMYKIKENVLSVNADKNLN